MSLRGRRVDVTNKLSTIYEDDEIVVYTAPNEDELKELLIDLLRQHGPMTIRDLHGHLSGLASEDKIRQALNHLAMANKVHMQDGRYYIAEIDDIYDDYLYDNYEEEYEYEYSEYEEYAGAGY